MKILKKSALFLLSLSVTLYLISFLLPNKAVVERSITAKANIDSTFEQINTIKNWQNWATVLNGDKEIKYTYKESGAGATQEWKHKYSPGKIIIYDSKKPNSINYVMRLYRYAPYMCNINIKQNADASITVHWVITLEAGSNPFKKYFCLFLDFLLGKEMEESLYLLVNHK